MILKMVAATYIRRCLYLSLPCLRGDTRGGRFGEDLGVGATEIVGVERGDVVELLLLDAADGERESVGGGGLVKEAQGRIPGQGFGDGGLAGHDDGSRFKAKRAQEPIASEKGFAETETVPIDAQVELAATGIQEGVDRPPLIAMRLR